ncbi:MAG: excinuclease ABC subunit A, partial [Candidatus Marivariicella framensis]
NLKNIDVAIPRNKMTVITGLSGSGKSSLAFDTLYAEGQRRYVESLSSYARQFMGRLNKPKVDKIIGISPAIAVEQKVNISNPRSTVGTKTEIYEYLKLLYSRIGVTYSPISGRVVKKDIVSDLIDFIKKLNNGKKLLLLAPIKKTESRTIKQRIDFLNQQGFARILVDNKIERIEPNKLPKAQFELVVDRVVINDSEEFYQRFADAVQIAFYEGNGKCSLKDLDLDKTVTFSNNFELDGIDFLNPNIHLFSFNNPYGACEKCEGYGDLVGINPELVIPDTSRSIYEEAISPWRSTGYRKFYSKLIESAINFDFPIHKPYFELTKAEKDILWNGNKFFTGIMSFFKKIEKKNYKIQNRVLLSRFRGKTICSDCKGSRLRNETNYVKVGGKSLPELIDLPIKELSIFFQKLNISKTEEKISSRILIEINSRVSVLNDLGLDYLTLNRKSNSLSGGESQRINIAVSLGSSLVGSMYILDEPSIGLHSRDNERLIKILKRLRDIGNTVIIIEHDEEIMTAADEIIDMGPEAGSFGGEIVATGSFKEILKSNTLTSKYLSGEMKIEVPKKRRKSNNWISVCGARENNLKNITAKFQIGGLTVVSGVSGSGKSTLVKDILYPALLRNFDIYTLKPGQFSSLDGDLNMIKSVEFINQNPIGRSSRSNPVTYIKAYDEIRALFANQNLSKNRNYKPKHFSFNVDGGRCDTCKGEGVVSIEMQFMADVILECDTCKGKRFKSEVREIKYNNYSIDQVLDLTIDEALNLFEFNGEKKLVRKLKPLNDVGLGYVTLGQSSTTLSGGEAQRIKLASFIAKGATKDKVLFIFDEPTTGLHFHDITKLLKSFDALLDNGHSLVVVEHNLELIKCADHMIELGPMAGKEGGQIVAQGTPEDVADVKNAPSSKYLKKKLSV